MRPREGVDCNTQLRVFKVRPARVSCVVFFSLLGMYTSTGHDHEHWMLMFGSTVHNGPRYAHALFVVQHQGTMLGAFSVGVKLDGPDDEKKQFSKLKDMYQPLTDWWTEKLNDQTVGDRIDGVALITRSTESPVVVVISQFGFSLRDEKIMKAQTSRNKQPVGTMTGRKTLEINPHHPAVLDLMAKVKADTEDIAARDAAQALSWNALVDPGQEIVEVIWLIPQDRVSERVVEQTVDASLPQIREPVMKVITREGLQQPTADRSQTCPFLRAWRNVLHKSRCRTTP